MTSSGLPARAFHRLLDAIPPAAGAVVMGTGIVSVALLRDGQHLLSAILLIIAGITWMTLALLLPVRARRDARRFARDLRHPVALTVVAGSEVLGTRLTLAGWNWAGVALLILGTVLWLGLVPYVLRYWKTPTVGSSFMLTVATESLALLSSTLAFTTRTAWLVYISIGLFCLGLGAYAFVLSRFEFRQLRVGAGDHWVTGGALGICALVAGRIVTAAIRTSAVSGAHGALKTVALVLWCLAMVWLPAIIAAELLSPRLAYAVPRWSTVFPLGMYAACSFAVGELIAAPGITDFARVWVWVAVAGWVVVFAAMLRRARALVPSEHLEKRERRDSNPRPPA